MAAAPLPPDPRIPVRLLAPGERPPAGAAVLVEGEPPALPDQGRLVARFDLPSPGHALGCACCAPRNPAAAVLDRLFLMRVRGEAAFFRDVAAITRSDRGAAVIRDALARDPVIRARFRVA
jgi:hypothetical protein